MSAAAPYLQHALAERQAADRETLPRRRLQHERSAERWEEMARAAEETERLSRLNAAHKAKHKLLPQ